MNLLHRTDGFPGRRPRAVMALGVCSVILVLGLAGCDGGGQAAFRHAGNAVLVKTTTRTSASKPRTTTTVPRSEPGPASAPSLPECGSVRDPFDPTDSPPPPGSAAIC